MPIQPNWPAPTWVKALTTTRVNGNLAAHVDDAPERVMQNRMKLMQDLNLGYEPMWLNQTHSTKVIEIKSPTTTSRAQGLEADGAFTQLTGVPCVVLTADCLPVLFCDTKGELVSAVHCGWRGLASGIIENTLKEIRLKANGNILAWLGPGIGPSHYEVGEDFRNAFIKDDLKTSNAFKPTDKKGKWHADMYLLARHKLLDGGVTSITGGDFCTYTDSADFYSYRREKLTGRMATLIWLAR